MKYSTWIDGEPGPEFSGSRAYAHCRDALYSGAHVCHMQRVTGATMLYEAMRSADGDMVVNLIDHDGDACGICGASWLDDEQSHCVCCGARRDT